jgi:hypothetical protein
MGHIVPSVEGGKAMYFLALLLTLRIREPCDFSCTLEDAEVPTSLFSEARQTEFSQRGKDTRIALIWHDHAHVHLRFSYLNMPSGALENIIQQALASESVIQYAGQDCEVESVDLSNTRWAGIASWTDIVSEGPGRRMRFTLGTPLFTSPIGGEGENTLPFPNPLTLFRAAHQLWQGLNGPALPYTGEQAVDLAKCVVAGYHLETTQRALHDGCFTGYLGWIEYTCLRKNEAAITSLNALARSAHLFYWLRLFD